jgi:hypothetical protein
MMTMTQTPTTMWPVVLQVNCERRRIKRKEQIYLGEMGRPRRENMLAVAVVDVDVDAVERGTDRSMWQEARGKMQLK